MEKYDFNKFVDKFIDDSHNLLNELEGHLLELEQNASNQEHIESVFRAMHTLKGIGSMFGFTAISEFTHHLETIYDRIREGLLVPDSAIFELTFASVDHIRNLLADQNIKDPALALRHSKLSKQIEGITASKPLIDLSQTQQATVQKKSVDPTRVITWYIQFFCTEELVKRAVNIIYIFQDLAKLGTYSVFKHSQEVNDILDNEKEVWGILLTTNVPLSDVEEVFMFVADNVMIVRSPEEPVASINQNNNEADPGQSLSIFELAKSIGAEIEKNEESLDKERTETNQRELLRPSLKSPRISVGTDKLDKLMYLVSELFTTRSELVTATRNADMSRIKLAVEKIDKLSSQFRNNALSIRLVPLRELTLKFKRLIRDLSNQLGKNIDFEVLGDETELDKNLVDSLADPFMHIVRNCIDHGIENPEIRKAKNKPNNGVIRFVASQSGNYIYIQISDDGNGIDTEHIRKKAIEKGFIQPNAILTERELLELIFLPGFSTAESLTQVSGRGVGMDVVKRAITNLRGSIEIETEKDKGTTFTIKLQQTIAIMDTLLIRAGSMHFTILLEEVEICELENHQSLANKQNNHLTIAGDLIPFVSLRDAFAMKGEAPETVRIIVIKRQNTRFALIADSIIGQNQAVIKPLESILQHKDYLSGASIMGDGNIAFMLDTQKLMELTERNGKLKNNQIYKSTI